MNIINKICSEFEKSGIKYCHFKSNQHLDKSFEGKSDFDILADYRKKTQVDIILAQCECKRFETVKINNYPGVENWLAFDYETGILYHIHLHFQLATGLVHVKEYILPWRDLILESAIRSSEFGIMISDPNVEMLILLTRMIVKANTKSKIKSFFGFYHLADGMQREYNYLKDRIDLDILLRYAGEIYGVKTVNVIKYIINENRVNSNLFRKLNRCLRKELNVFKRISFLKAKINSTYISAVVFKSKVYKKLDRFHVSKKTTASGGKIIAFIGVDGSGKSTLSKEIVLWLKKIESKKIYMGAGDGAQNLVHKVIKGAQRKYRKRKRDAIAVTIENSLNKIEKKLSLFGNPKKFLIKIINCMSIYNVVKNNHKRLINMNRYRLNGGFSVLDRYPQIQQENMNDGIKLKKYANETDSFLVRYMANREMKFMRIVNEIQPDIVFRLNISIESCMNRKEHNSTSYGYFKSKLESVKQIKFPNSILFEIDAEQKIEDEILQIKRLIWDNIG